jgi:hypothetical protein
MGAGSVQSSAWTPDDVRRASKRVTDQAELVSIDHDRLNELELPDVPEPEPLPLEFAVTFNAINFGSGWHPYLSKLPGKSGNETISTRLLERFDRQGPFPAAELTGLTADDCAAFLHQHLHPPVDDLMGLYAQSLNDLGRFLLERFGGSFHALVDAADGSATALVLLLQQMPLYRDVATYRGEQVPFLKRAQITASDIGTFHDLAELTLFADNLIPHVLRIDGVLVLDQQLKQTIEAGQLLDAGGQAEVELRAAAVHAVELVAERTGIAPRHLDHALWHAGQQPKYKAAPRPRVRTWFY